MKLSKEVTFGIFALITIAMLVYGLNFMVGSQLFGSPLILYAKYTNVEGLNVGSPIRINGLPVGRVSNLDLNLSEGSVTATLKFDRQIEIPTNSQAMIISTDLLGTKGIKVWVPDTAMTVEEFYESGETIKGTMEAGIFAEAEELVTTKGAQILVEIGRLSVQLNEIVAQTKALLDDQGSQSSIRATIENIRTSSANLTNITYEVDSIAREITTIANDAVAIVRNVEDNNENIDQIIDNVRMTTDSLVDAGRQVKFLMTDAAQAVGRVEGMISKLDTTGGTLGLLINDTQLYDSLAMTTQEVNALLRELQANPQRFFDDIKLYIFERRERKRNKAPRPMSLLLTSIRRLYTVADANRLSLRGAEMAHPAFLDDAFLLVESGKVQAAGPMTSLNPAWKEGPTILDCQDRLVLPGLVDSHTHLVYPRSRAGEFVDRIRGLSYEEIGKRGGGILNSARDTVEIEATDLLADLRARAREILALGTTTVEIKSGYGLSLAGELKLLRAAKQLQAEGPIRVKTTFLGAHAIPLAYRDRRQAYLDLVCQEMLPQVAEEGLADYIDVFCDRGYFTPKETIHILQKGAEYGLPGKIHANELGQTGGVQAGVQAGAYSVDHLEHCGPEEIEALKGTDTVPCLLPTVAFFLGLPYAPARELIAAHLPVALATDYNPGSSPGGSLPFVMSLACLKMGLIPEEALSAVTVNAAYALRESHRLGSLAPGYAADFVITQPLESLAEIPYAYASNLLDQVWIGGELQWKNPRP